MRAIRSGKGLGDNFYLQSIARHLVGRGEEVEVCTHWPDVFRPIKDKVTLSPWRRDRIDLVAHYIERKGIGDTDQFVDCCIRCGIGERIPLSIDWAPVNRGLVDRFRSFRKPVIVVQMPREPMGRTDGYGLDLLPDCRAIQRIIDRVGNAATFVQVGAGQPMFRFNGLHVDLANQTSVLDLIDVAWAADAALGYCSFIVPMAESLRKPTLLVWSRRGLRSRNEFIRRITPNKIVHRPETTHVVVDDADDDELNKVTDAFLEQVGGPTILRRQDRCDRGVGSRLCG